MRIIPSSSVLQIAESGTAQIFEIRELQPLRWPGLKWSFGFRFERHSFAGLGAGPTPWRCWPKGTRPAAMAGQGALTSLAAARLSQPPPTMRGAALTSAGGGAGKGWGCRAAPPCGWRGTSIVLHGAERWPAGRSKPHSPPAATPGGPQPGSAPQLPAAAPPPPPADSEFSQPWLHN